MNEITYMVIEGTHKNLMINQLLLKKQKKFMVLLIKKAEDFAAGLIQKMWTIITIEHGL